MLCSIAAGVAFAAVLGAAIPSLLHRLNLDPKVAAGPMVLALTDMLTLACYFAVAAKLLGCDRAVGDGKPSRSGGIIAGFFNFRGGLPAVFLPVIMVFWPDLYPRATERGG